MRCRSESAQQRRGERPEGPPVRSPSPSNTMFFPSGQSSGVVHSRRRTCLRFGSLFAPGAQTSAPPAQAVAIGEIFKIAEEQNSFALLNPVPVFPLRQRGRLPGAKVRQKPANSGDDPFADVKEPYLPAGRPRLRVVPGLRRAPFRR